MTFDQLVQRRIACVALLLSMICSGARAQDDPPTLDQGLSIHVKETHGVARDRDPVSFAFPLKKSDNLRKTKQLVVLGPNGRAVAAQFRVQQRWNGSPDDTSKAIRWLLVDLQASVDANSETVYTLRRKRNRDGDGKPPKLKVKVTGNKIKINTGVAKFHLSRNNANLIDQLWADLDSNGKVSKSELMIDRPPEAGFVLEDRFGTSYSSTNWDVNVFVEEQGPLRTVVRADGRHAADTPTEGIGRDFFMYRTRYTFYAGKPFVRVQHTLRNAYLDDPLGRIGFEGYTVQTGLVPGFSGGPMQVTFGTDGSNFMQFPGPSRIYQDSHGGLDWAASPNTTFQGFKVYNEVDTPVYAGPQAQGYMHVGTNAVGFSMTMRYWFENFPKGFRYDGEGGLMFDIFPEAFGAHHWLDDGQQKTTDFLLCAHTANGITLAEAVGTFQNPMRPYPDAEWIRVSQAWADQGDLDKPDHSDNAMIAYDDGQLGSLYNSAFNNNSYSFGWSEFGEQTWARNSHTTGSPRNKLTYFDKFAMAGSQSAFRIAEAFALHSQDIRTYHIEGFRREDHPTAVLWEGLPPWSFSPDKLGRDSLDPALDPHRANIPDGGHGWNGFDIEHLVLDDLYEYYLMTGDLVTLDALNEIGHLMRTWPIYSLTKAPGTTRGVGWGMRAIVKIYQVTGNPKFLSAANDLLASVVATYGQDPSPTNGLVYHYITEYPPHNNHIADDEYDLPWQLAVTIHGMLLHHRETGDPRSLAVALDVSDYIVDYGWNGVAMNEALANDDHTNINYKGDNTGVNTWIPSALALAYRQDPRPEFLSYAQIMYDSIPFITDPLTYNGYGVHHWWHSYRALLLGY